MDRNVILAVVLLLFLNAPDVSTASLITKLRFFVAVTPKRISHAVRASPSPSPVPVVPIDVNKTVNKTTPEDHNPKVPAGSKGSSNNNTNTTSTNNTTTTTIIGNISNNTNVTGTVVGQSVDKQTGSGKNHETKEKKGGGEESKGRDSPPIVTENCTDVDRRCTDRGSLVACIHNYDAGSKQLLVLVQNVGQGTLKVNLKALNPIDDAWMDVPEHQTKMMNLSLGSRNEVRVDAENGECVLHLDPPASLRNFALHLPSYDQLLTPINGAYFLIITVIIFGATWACCSFRNRRRQAGIPYQELEMSAPESASANNVEVAEVWDQDWDDDWDEENAVRSPALRHGISVNGLTSRSTNKDG